MMDKIVPMESVGTLHVERRNGKTILSNDKGDKWECLGNMPEVYSIAALVSYTLNNRLKWTAAVADHIKISMTIEILDE